MKIVYVSELIYPFSKGGAERRIYEIGRRLVDRGHDVHWYGMVPDGELAAGGLVDGIRVHRVCSPGNLFAAEGRRAVWPALRFASRLALQMLRDPRPLRHADALDCSVYPFFHCLLLRTLAPRTPLIVSWWEFWGSYWLDYMGPAGVAGQIVELMTTRAATHIVSDSHRTLRRLVAVGVKPSRVTVIYSGVDNAAIAAVDAAPRCADVVYFGRLKNHKNVDVLLRAVALARAHRPELRCLIIGGGPEEAALKELGRELGLDGGVEFAGSIESNEELLAAVKASKLFVHPSTKEGGGSITLLEANACGVPAIAVRHPLGIDPRLIDHGVNGFWVDELSARLIADQIVAALNDEGRLATMRQQSRRFAQDFDWDRAATASEDLYARLARDNGAGR
jgi:L-malate glycosyltransferase